MSEGGRDEGAGSRKADCLAQGLLPAPCMTGLETAPPRPRGPTATGRRWLIWITPDDGSVGVVLANVDPPAVGPVMAMVKELVTK